MAEQSLRDNRPLSPHLQIYRGGITMMMSIIHRITGGALYFGTLILAAWLIAAASGPDAYAVAQDLLGGWFGRLVLFGYTWALIHHMLGGVRHLIWDTGRGFGLDTVQAMAWGTLILSISATVLVWVAGYSVMAAS